MCECKQAGADRKVFYGEVSVKIPMHIPTDPDPGGFTSLPVRWWFRVAIPEGWRYVSASHLIIEDGGFKQAVYEGHQVERRFDEGGAEYVFFQFHVPDGAPVDPETYIVRSGSGYQILLERSCRPSFDVRERHAYYQDSEEDPIIQAVEYAYL